MAKRKAYAPFSLTSEAGVGHTPVEGYIDVEQKIYPTVQTGVVNENGKWVGVKASDTEFRNFTSDVLIANGSSITVPRGPRDPDNFIDMTGFRDIFLAIKVSNGGNYRIETVFGSSSYSFANLNPIGTGELLRGAYNPSSEEFNAVMLDGADSITADVFIVYFIGNGRLRDQKNFQFKITNNSGGDSDIETAYMRLV